MLRYRASASAVGTLVAGVFGAAAVNEARSCGGFFCQLVPIDQAGEQIVFRQDGDTVTAVVLIQYAGEAENFSWVVPVPGIPELSAGSDLVFAPLELATRPQFLLEVEGSPCPFPVTDGGGGAGGGGGAAAPDSEDDGVEILQQLSVGPFDILVVSSDDPEAMANWLVDNDYDLTERGRDLIAPYVTEGMNFVAVKLRKDQGVGDLQPLIMRYQTTIPMVPIRLTAVAAQPDMGIIVWLLGGARAVPLNYLHVTPNYTLLNWYAGTFNAYASYQGLITTAMNEAGGQGFATDFAGRDLDLLAQLPAVDTFTGELARVALIDDDAQVIAELAGFFVFPQPKVLEILRRVLPLPEGEDEFIYQVPELLTAVFTAEELAAARSGLVIELDTAVIDPLRETLEVLDTPLYLTRLYTTLSAEEMTLDPTFSFNPDLADQGLERNAKMDVSCGTEGSRWTLTLGAGTGRDGEVVIEGSGLPPGFAAPLIEQDSIWRTEVLETSGAGQVVTQKSFPIAQVIGQDVPGAGGDGLCGVGAGGCGAGAAGGLLVSMLGLSLRRSRR